MTKTKLIPSEIKHLAELANLFLSSEEIDKYTTQISETINYIENLQELDTTKTETTNNGIRTENVFFEDGTECARKFSQKEAVANGKNIKDSKYFVVKRVHHET